MAVRRWLGDTLLNAGLVTKQQLDDALAAQKRTGETLNRALVTLGYLTETDLQRTLCADADIPFLGDGELVAEATALALIPPALARQHTALPLRIESRHLIVAIADPFDMLVIRVLTRAAGKSVRVVSAPRVSIARAIEVAYHDARDAIAPASAVAMAGAATVPRFELARGDDDVAFEEPSSHAARPALVRSDADDSAATATVDDVLRRGVEMEATDIHLEPGEAGIRVRYRVDGILHDGETYPKTEQAAIIGRIRTLAGTTGQTRVRIDARDVEFRASSFPTLHGEDVVLRLLDRSRVPLPLDKLGIEADDLLLLRTALQRSHGLIPVAGPIGSGATTTLYAALLELHTADRAILTLEDPIEYEIPQIRQSQLDARAGLTFAGGLRSVLQHDPDVILVGELRDHETLQVALSAALAGHLLLTSLHATSAAGTIPRLLEMGAEPFALASAVPIFLSQRLVRTLCEDCREKVDMPLAVRRRFGLEDVTLYGPRGCANCRDSGYRGRIGIFELLPMTPDIVTAIYERQQPDQIQRDAGRPTILQDGVRKVRSGITTLDEVLRVTA